MRFGLTAEQSELAGAVREMLAKECTPAVIRAAWEAAPGELDREVWSALAKMGVLDVLVPENRGGLGLDMCFLVPILEECGRVALPHAVVETTAVAAPLLTGPVGGALIAASLGASPVACAADADSVLVDDDGSLWLLPRSGVRFDSLPAVDRARRLAGVTAINTSAPGASRLTDDPADVEAAFDRGALGTAAFLVGLSQAMLDMTVAYVKDRHQFGVPVGSFQAVKHQLADVLKEISFARAVVQRAAWSVAEGEPTARRDVSTAKAMASEAALFAGKRCLQCHGAIGYTVEYDLHLFLKRSVALARAWGDAAYHRSRVAASLGIR
ncbi:MAG TPA: acyl-CoA dehydrogenase family protein [Acidimicrobiales bacterium]|nr:acyl-CoA dehydrogenase family protein [Acidimicrobiales bacterium]